MPLKRCTVGGRSGWKWGDQGKCYAGTGSRKKALKQAAAIRSRGYVGNRKASAPNPLRIDPTRLLTLRRRFQADVRRRFNRLLKEIKQLVVGEDVFGLRPRIAPPFLNARLVRNNRWALLSTSEKVKAFTTWLEGRIEELFFQGEWWMEYIEEAYYRGVTRSFDEVRRGSSVGGVLTSPQEHAWGREEFSRQVMSGQSISLPTLPGASRLPVANVGVAKIRDVKGRFFSEKARTLSLRLESELRGLTTSMAQQISREVLKGVEQGKAPQEVAAAIEKATGVTSGRAMTIARTELTRAHAEAQLEAMGALGVERVGVAAEWSAAATACPMCAPLQGVVMKVTEAYGMIPRHPNCRCAWVPAKVGEDKEKQKATKRAIDQAIGRSKRAERKSKSQGKETSDWGPAVPVSKARPEKP